jgi:PAS domain-containing protein
MLEGTGAPETLDPLLLLDRIEEAFYAIDRDWRFHTINRKAEEFWGRPRGDMIGRSMPELFPHFLNSPPYEAHKRAMESDEPLRVETISTATGAPVEIRLYPNPNGLSV